MADERKRRRGEVVERIVFDEDTGKPRLALTASLKDPKALDRLMKRVAKLIGVSHDRR